MITQEYMATIEIKIQEEEGKFENHVNLIWHCLFLGFVVESTH